MNKELRHALSMSDRIQGLTPPEQFSPIPTILVAIDNPMTRHQVATMLRSEKFIVDEAEDQNQAVDWLAHCLESAGGPCLPDIIVASMDSIRMNGTHLLEELRQLRWTVPFILIADEAGYRSADDIKPLGSVFVFKHPFAAKDFLTAVLYFLGREKRFRRIAGSTVRTG